MKKIRFNNITQLLAICCIVFTISCVNKSTFLNPTEANNEDAIIETHFGGNLHNPEINDYTLAIYKDSDEEEYVVSKGIRRKELVDGLEMVMFSSVLKRIGDNVIYTPSSNNKVYEILPDGNGRLKYKIKFNDDVKAFFIGGGIYKYSRPFAFFSS